MTCEALYFVFYYVIARPLNETRRLYESSRNLRQYGIPTYFTLGMAVVGWILPEGQDNFCSTPQG